MRKAMMFVGIPIVAIGVAAGIAVTRHYAAPKSSDKFADDLQRAQAAGLDLAQSQGGKKYALTEIAPDSKPQPSKTLKQNSGPKAIRSKNPTVMAAPEPVAAETVEEIPLTQVASTSSPAPAEIPVPAVGRPVPQTSGSDEGPILAGGMGRGRTGSEGGTGMGGIFGAIIRGGGVDGDNCDPRPGSSRPPMRTPVYGRPTGMGDIRRPGMPSSLPSGGGIGARPRGGAR